MYCKKCGTRIPEGADFCPGCQAPLGQNTTQEMPQKPAPRRKPRWLIAAAAAVVVLGAAIAIWAVMQQNQHADDGNTNDSGEAPVIVISKIETAPIDPEPVPDTDPETTSVQDSDPDAASEPEALLRIEVTWEPSHDENGEEIKLDVRLNGTFDDAEDEGQGGNLSMQIQEETGRKIFYLFRTDGYFELEVSCADVDYVFDGGMLSSMNLCADVSGIVSGHYDVGNSIIYRSYTGSYFWAPFSINDGVLGEYDASWIDSNGRSDEEEEEPSRSTVDLCGFLNCSVEDVVAEVGSQVPYDEVPDYVNLCAGVSLSFVTAADSGGTLILVEDDLSNGESIACSVCASYPDCGTTFSACGVTLGMPESEIKAALSWNGARVIQEYTGCVVAQNQEGQFVLIFHDDVVDDLIVTLSIDERLQYLALSYIDPQYAALNDTVQLEEYMGWPLDSFEEEFGGKFLGVDGDASLLYGDFLTNTGDRFFVNAIGEICEFFLRAETCSDRYSICGLILGMDVRDAYFMLPSHGFIRPNEDHYEYEWLYFNEYSWTDGYRYIELEVDEQNKITSIRLALLPEW